MSIIKLIFTAVQHMTVGIFLVAGICAFVLKKYHLALIDCCIAITNFVIFYGNRFLK